jgi:hypothetical protein
MPIHVVLHFLDPIDKTFGFTEPDTLELGRSSGFIENETLSRKQGIYHNYITNNALIFITFFLNSFI